MHKLNLLFTILFSLAIHISAQTFDVTNFGAVGNGSTVTTQAIQNAIDSCTASGGGTVLIPSGTFVTGTIYLKNNVALKIASGATLKGSSSISDYPDVTPTIRSYVGDNYEQKSIIYAENASHITLTGPGTLDGNGIAFLGASERPYGFRFISCQNVIIENIELKNSAFWMMHNLNIDSLTIRNVNIYNHNNSNNDGINVDGCRNVLIENCTVDSNDDPLVFKSTALINCENVVARNCTLATWSRAIKIGTETMGGFRNIHVHDCVVEFSSVGLPPLFGIGKCGINLAIVDGGFMENVTVENITMEGISTPIVLRLGNQGRKYTDTASTPGVGTIKDVTLRNITATAYDNLTSSITGIPGHYPENITLEDIQIHFPGGHGPVPPGFAVPEKETSKPENDIFGDTLPAYGLYVRHIKNLSMDNVCFTWDAADARQAIVLEDVIQSDNYVAVPNGTNTTCTSISTAIDNQEIARIKVRVDLANRTLHLLNAPVGEVLSIWSITGQRITSKKINHYVEEIKINGPSGIYFITNSSGNLAPSKILLP